MGSVLGCCNGPSTNSSSLFVGPLRKIRTVSTNKLLKSNALFVDFTFSSPCWFYFRILLVSTLFISYRVHRFHLQTVFRKSPERFQKSNSLCLPSLNIRSQNMPKKRGFSSWLSVNFYPPKTRNPSKNPMIGTELGCLTSRPRCSRPAFRPRS